MALVYSVVHWVPLLCNIWYTTRQFQEREIVHSKPADAARAGVVKFPRLLGASAPKAIDNGALVAKYGRKPETSLEPRRSPAIAKDHVDLVDPAPSDRLVEDSRRPVEWLP